MHQLWLGMSLEASNILCLVPLSLFLFNFSLLSGNRTISPLKINNALKISSFPSFEFAIFILERYHRWIQKKKGGGEKKNHSAAKGK